MISVVVSQRIPRGDDYTVLPPGGEIMPQIPGVDFRIHNPTSKPIYLKWKI
jgi:vancomycin resistance protein YoaR